MFQKMRQVIQKGMAIFLSLTMVFGVCSNFYIYAAEEGNEESLEQWIPYSLENANFEMEVVAGNIPGWRTYPDVLKEGYSIEVATEQKQEGEQSLRLVDTGGGSVGAISNPISVSPGIRYRLHAYTYIEEGAKSAAIFYIKFFTEQKKEIHQISKVVKIYNEWTLIETDEVIAPEEAAYAEIWLYSGGANITTAYFDNISLQYIKQEPTEPEESIKFEEPEEMGNFDFEEPTEEYKIPNWVPYLNPPVENTKVIVTDEEAYTGKYSIKLVDGNEGQPVGAISGVQNIIPDKTYIASVYAKMVDENKPGANLYIKFYDEQNKEVGSQNTRIAEPKGQWVPIRVEAVAPTAAVTARVLLYSGNPNIGTVYYDQVTFSERETLELPFSYGTSIDLGEATIIPKGQAQGIAIGKDEIYIGTNGTPTTFYVLDAETGKVKFSQPMPGIDVLWAITIGADKNVYFSGTKDGILYRYLPKEQKIENLGENPSNKWTWQLDASTDGKIYGSTSSPEAKVYVYHIATGEFEDLGVMYEGQQYVRGAGVTDDYLYVGIGSEAHLLQINRKTGERKEIMLPVTGKNTMVSEVFVRNGYLFVVNGVSFSVLKEETGEVMKTISQGEPEHFDGLISPISPYDSDLVYYRNRANGELWTYNLATHKVGPVEPKVNLGNVSLKSINWIHLKQGKETPKTYLALVSFGLEYMLYDPETGQLISYLPNVNPQGIAVQSLEMSPEGKIYMGGYQGAMTIYNPQTGAFERQETKPEQIEGMGFLNGKVYFGTYGGARIYRYDPTQPYHYGETKEDNPGLIYAIPEEQSRPFTFTSGDDQLFVGTIADYGCVQGAVSIYNEKKEEWKTYPTVENQSVIGLAYQNGKLYGSTTVWGGGGSSPVAEKAKIFLWDVEKDEKVHEFSPDSFGITIPKMIGELSFGPDGLLWGILWGEQEDGKEGFGLFALDPQTNQIIKSRVFNMGARASTWRPFFMRWGEDGLLYTTLGRLLLVIDPETLLEKQLVNDYVHLMTISPNGTIYYARDGKPNLYKLPVPMKEITLTGPTTLYLGEKQKVEITSLLVNGKQGTFDGLTIEYVSKNPDIVSVENGVLTAHQKGKAELYVKVSSEDQLLASNILSIEVKERPRNDKEDIPSEDPVGDFSKVQKPDKIVVEKEGIKLEIAIDEEQKKASVAVEETSLLAMIQGMKEETDEIQMKVPMVEGVTQYELILPQKAIAMVEKNIHLKIHTEFGKVNIPTNRINQKAIKEGEKISICIQKFLGERPILEVDMLLSGDKVDLENTKVPIEVRIPYEIKEEEKGKTEHLMIEHQGDQGDILPISNAKYNPRTQEMVFTTTDLGRFYVIYIEKSFEDIYDLPWATKAIEVLASKGIIQGKTETLFGPQEAISRAEFITLLIRTLSLKEEVEDHFKDVFPTDYFYEAVGIARKVGIVSGVGDERFNPHEAITREDMAVMIHRALVATEKIRENKSYSALEKYQDDSHIADYAKESVSVLTGEGMIQGDQNHSFHPTRYAKRAEAARVLYYVYYK